MEKRTSPVVLLAAAGFFLAAAPAVAQEEQEKTQEQEARYQEASREEAAIFDKLRSSFTAAYEAGNAAGVASTFAMDGTLMLPDGSHVTGREAIHQAYHDVFEGWESQTLEVRQDGMHVFGDHAFSHGAYTVTATPTGAQGQVTLEGHYANSLQRQSDGTWKIVWHIVTGPDPRS